MIEVKGITKKYGDFVAVNEISFKVEKGHILGFLGPNGAGKTTTMRILTTYMPPTDGTAVIDGYDILESPDEVRRRVGYLPENPPLYNDLTVEEYLNYVGKLKGLKGAGLKERVEYVVDTVGLEDKFKSVISTLSKGYRQRVGIAQAIIHDPGVVILDEPTIGLDPNQVIEVRKLIRKLAGDHTVILSTHILSEVTNTCDDVVIIHKGRIVAADSIENLTSQSEEGVRFHVKVKDAGKVNFEEIESLSQIKKIESMSGNTFELVLTSVDVAPEVAQKLVEMEAGLLEFAPRSTTLEEIFSRLTIQ